MIAAGDDGRARGRAQLPESFAGQEASIAVDLVLAAELAVVRERLDTLERLLASAGVLDPGAIDAFVADAAANSARDRLRQRLIGRVFGVFKRDGQTRARLLAAAAQAEDGNDTAADAQSPA